MTAESICLFKQRTLIYLVRGSITVRLTSCLTGLDSIKLVNLYLIQHKKSIWILTGQTGGQTYSDTSPYELSECTLDILSWIGLGSGYGSVGRAVASDTKGLQF